MAAATEEDVRRRLEHRGYQVVSLSSERSRRIEVAESSPPTAPAPGPPGARSRPGLRWRLPRTLLESILGIAAVAGLLLLAGGSFRGDGPAPRAHPTSREVRLRLTGSVRLADGGDVAGARLSFRLPQIPLNLERTAREVLVDPRTGQFRLELDFATRNLPGFCSLTVEKDGYASRTVPDVPLQGEPLTGRFPEVVLEPRP